MFPRRYFAGRYFAPRYFPQSGGGPPPDTGQFTICGDFIEARFTYPSSLSLPWGLTKRTN